jgi:surfactin synthase thioesterase subunit
VTDPDVDALLIALLPGRHAISAAVEEYRHADARLRDAGDNPFALIRACVGVVLAAEALKVAGAAQERAARDALACFMSATGAPAIETEAHRVSIQDARDSVIIVDADQIPAHLWRQPPPAPDKTAILKAMKAGVRVQGAEVSNGGSPVLTIHPRRERNAA